MGCHMHYHKSRRLFTSIPLSASSRDITMLLFTIKYKRVTKILMHIFSLQFRKELFLQPYLFLWLTLAVKQNLWSVAVSSAVTREISATEASWHRRAFVHLFKYTVVLTRGRLPPKRQKLPMHAQTMPGNCFRGCCISPDQNQTEGFLPV